MDACGQLSSDVRIAVSAQGRSAKSDELSRERQRPVCVPGVHPRRICQCAGNRGLRPTAGVESHHHPITVQGDVP